MLNLQEPSDIRNDIIWTDDYQSLYKVQK